MIRFLIIDIRTLVVNLWQLCIFGKFCSTRTNEAEGKLHETPKKIIHEQKKFLKNNLESKS